MADYQLQVSLDKNHLRFEAKPTYLGVTLDRSLIFKVHLTKLKNKVSSPVALIKRLAGTKWGATVGVLRTSVLALAYSPVEYCAQAWTQSAHAYKIDVPLNEAMRLIPGCLRSTLVSQLPFLSGIPPPQKHRNQICIKPIRELGALTISFMKFFMSRMYLSISHLKGPSDHLLKTSN